MPLTQKILSIRVDLPHIDGSAFAFSHHNNTACRSWQHTMESKALCQSLQEQSETKTSQA